MLMRIITSCTKILFHGTKIILSSVRKSIAEEINLSNEAARTRKREKEGEYSQKCQLSLDEAMKILNVSKIDHGTINRQYKMLYESNCKANGGSFYIQSKVVRAKERLDLEVSDILKRLEFENKDQKELSR